MQSSATVARRLWWFTVLNAADRSRGLRTDERDEALVARSDSGGSCWSGRDRESKEEEREDSRVDDIIDSTLPSPLLFVTSAAAGATGPVLYDGNARSK
ncbi:unnamed protein product [Lota lota]